MNARSRRAALRLALSVLWVAAAAALFLNYRGHTVLVDNKDAPDGSRAASGVVKVVLDGGKPVEFFRGDRDKFAVVGARHRIRAETAGGSGAAAEKEFRLPVGADVFLLSVPKLLAGVEPFVEPFRTEAAPSRDEEPPAADTGAPGSSGPEPALPKP